MSGVREMPERKHERAHSGMTPSGSLLKIGSSRTDCARGHEKSLRSSGLSRGPEMPSTSTRPAQCPSRDPRNNDDLGNDTKDAKIAKNPGESRSTQHQKDRPVERRAFDHLTESAADLQRTRHNIDFRDELKASRDPGQHRSVVRSTRRIGDRRDQLKAPDDLGEYRDGPRSARNEIARKDERKAPNNLREPTSDAGSTHHNANYRDELKAPDVWKEDKNAPRNARDEKGRRDKLRALENPSPPMSSLKSPHRKIDSFNGLRMPGDGREPGSDPRTCSNRKTGGENNTAPPTKVRGQDDNRARGKSKRGNNIQPSAPRKAAGQLAAAGKLLCSGKIKGMATRTRADASNTAAMKEWSGKKGYGEKDPNKNATNSERESSPRSKAGDPRGDGKKDPDRSATSSERESIPDRNAGDLAVVFFNNVSRLPGRDTNSWDHPAACDDWALLLYTDKNGGTLSRIVRIDGTLRDYRYDEVCHFNPRKDPRYFNEQIIMRLPVAQRGTYMAIARNEAVDYYGRRGETISQKWVCDVIGDLDLRENFANGLYHDSIMYLYSVLRWDESSGSYNNSEVPEYIDSDGYADWTNNDEPESEDDDF